MPLLPDSPTLPLALSPAVMTTRLGVVGSELVCYVEAIDATPVLPPFCWPRIVCGKPGRRDVTPPPSPVQKLQSVEPDKENGEPDVRRMF